MKKKKTPSPKPKLAIAPSVQPRLADVELVETAKMGRPTLYLPEFAHIVERFCEKHSATDAEIADLLGVTVSTINLWKKLYVDFSESITRGKKSPDDEIEASLFKKAKGFTRKSEKVFQYEGGVVRAETRVYFPPDQKSIEFWLKNRRPEVWREKVDFNHRIDDSLDTVMGEIRERVKERHLKLMEKSA